MALLGLIVTLLGFLISLLSLTMTQSVNGRMGMVIVGILVSLVGIVGVLNPAYIKTAIWRK